MEKSTTRRRTNISSKALENTMFNSQTSKAPPTGQLDIQKLTTPYTYTSPETSPFYDNFFSPSCDFLCKFLPDSLAPDCITILGLIFSFLAFSLTGNEPLIKIFCGDSCDTHPIFSAIYNYRHLFSALLWALYSICDNLDGKQARRLKKSSKRGEFVDHACDSLAASFSTHMWAEALAPNRFKDRQFLILCILCQQPLLTATWAHIIIGRLLLGASINSKNYFTVDELNFILLPLLNIIRQFYPILFDAPAHTLTNTFEVFWFPGAFLYKKLSHVLGCREDDISIGAVLVVLTCTWVFINNLNIIRKLGSFHHYVRILPSWTMSFMGLLILHKTALIHLPFSLTCIQLLNFQSNGEFRSLQAYLNLWIPGIAYLVTLYAQNGHFFVYLISNFPIIQNFTDFLLSNYPIINIEELCLIIIWSIAWIYLFSSHRAGIKG